MAKVLTAAEQVEAMKHLTAGSAAWLVGRSARTLRDRPDCPRNPDKTFDAQNLIAWSHRQIPDAKLDDAELEQVLTAAEHLAGHGSALVPIAGLLDALLQQYGDQGMILFARVLRDHFRVEIEIRKICDEPPSAEEQREIDEYNRQAERDNHTREELKITTTCMDCKRIRLGTKWLKRPVPVGHVKADSLCPACYERGRAKGN